MTYVTFEEMPPAIQELFTRIHVGVRRVCIDERLSGTFMEKCVVLVSPEVFESLAVEKAGVPWRYEAGTNSFRVEVVHLQTLHGFPVRADYGLKGDETKLVREWDL